MLENHAVSWKNGAPYQYVAPKARGTSGWNFTREGRNSPEGQKWRCQARIKKRGGSQCGYAREPGRLYCKFHNGRRSYLRFNGRRCFGGFPTFYSKFLGPTLAKALTEVASEPLTKQTAIYDELALARATAQQAVKMAAIALEPPPGIVIDDATKRGALALIMEVVGQVSILVERAAKIEASASDKLSLRAVDAFVVQIVRIIAEELGSEYQALAEKICGRIKTDIRVPLDAMRGKTAGAAETAARSAVQINVLPSI